MKLSLAISILRLLLVMLTLNVMNWSGGIAAPAAAAAETDPLVQELAAKLTLAINKAGKKNQADLRLFKADLVAELKKLEPGLPEPEEIFQEIIVEAMRPELEAQVKKQGNLKRDLFADKSLFDRIIERKVRRQAGELGLSMKEPGGEGPGIGKSPGGAKKTTEEGKKPAEGDKKSPEEDKLEQIKNKLDELKAVGDYDTPYFLIQSGVTILDPFAITQTAPGVFVINPSKAEARGFVEAIARSRYAWRNGSKDNRHDFPGIYAWIGNEKSEGNAKIGEYALDFELRGGFAFAGTSRDASTIVGGGDGYAALSLGLPVYREWLAAEQGSYPTIFTVNIPEAEVAFVSSRNAGDIHTDWAVGIGTAWGIPLSPQNKRKVEVLGLFGYSQVEQPRLAPGTTTLIVNAAGFPEFNPQPALMFKVETRVPIGRTGYLSLGGRYYNSNGDPDPWSMSLGYTISLEALAKLLLQ